LRLARGISNLALGGYLLALAAWIAVIYWKIYTGFSAGNLFADSELEFVDLVYFYAAALLAKNSPFAGSNPYEPAGFTTWVNQALAPAHLTGTFAFQYPPYCLLFFRPLAELSLPYAWLVWSALGVLAVVAAVALVCAGSWLPLFARIAFVLGALASFPVWAALRIGQTSLIETAAIALALYLMRARPLASGLSSGLCMLKPQFAAPVIFAGLASGRRRYLSGLAISLAALLLVSLCEVNLPAMLSFAGSVLRTEAHSRLYTHLVPERMQSLRGTLVLLTGGDGHVVAVITYTVWLLVIIAMAWLWFRIYRKLGNAPDQPGTFSLLLAISLLATLLFSPHCYAYDHSLLAVICPLLWIHGDCRPSDGRVPWTRLAMRILIVCLPILTWVHAFFISAVQAAGIQSLFLSGLLLLALAASELATRLARSTTVR